MSKWPMVELSQIAEVIAGQSPDGKHYNANGEGLPFYQGKKDFTDRYIAPAGTWTRESTKVAEEGDILMSVRAPVGPVNLAVENCCIGRGLAAIRPSDDVSRDFLFYFLQSIQEQIAGSEGAVFASINKSQISALQIPLPPLDEQKRIVAKLDEASDLIERVRTLESMRRKHLADARQSLLDEALEVDGAKVTLASMCEVITDGDHQPPPKSESGVPFITISCINKVSRQVDLDAGFRVSRDYFDSLQESRKPRMGDVLLTVTGSYGIPVMVKDDRPFCFQRHIALLRPKPGVSAEWLSQVLRTSSVRGQIERGATGTAQKTLSLKALRALSIPDWTFERQIEASIRVRKIEEELDSSLEHLALSGGQVDSLRKSIVSAEFVGQS